MIASKLNGKVSNKLKLNHVRLSYKITKSYLNLEDCVHFAFKLVNRFSAQPNCLF